MRAHAGEDGAQGGGAAHLRLVTGGALAEAPRLAESRRAHEPVDDGPDHRLAALRALPDEALGGGPPGGDPPDRRFDGHRGDAGLARRAGRRHAKTLPFHCMWTGTKSESAQGNTLRCRVSFILTTAMIAALWPQSPCSKARDGYRTMPCRFADRPSIAGQGEPAPATLRPRTRVWGKRMPGASSRCQKSADTGCRASGASCLKWHFPLARGRVLGGARKANRNQRHKPPPLGFHGSASPRSRRRRPALCGLVALRDCCHGFAELLNPQLSVFLAVRTGNDLFGLRVAFGLADL